MTPPELLSCVVPPPESAVAPTEAETSFVEDVPQPAETFDVRLEDILAAGQRLWVRGQILPGTEANSEEARKRWRFWREPAREGAAAIGVTTRIHGQVCAAKTTLSPDHRFEVLGHTPLPPSLQGWQLAQTQVSLFGQSIHKSSLVLTPPRKARQAVVVVLPVASTAGTESVRRFAHSFDARGLAPVLRRLVKKASPSLYYLASVPAGHALPPAEVALAANALGWPHGHVLLVPGNTHGPAGTLSTAVDRLRWLFAGSLDLIVLNLEPLAQTALAEQSVLAEDRAAILRLIQPDDDPWSAVAVAPEKESTAPAVSLPRPRRPGLVTQHPIVFCHGMLTLSTLRMQLPQDLNCFFPLGEQLRARGFEVFFPQVAPTSGVKQRAEQLRDQIRRWTEVPVNLVAHSMGGLDARWMISHLDMADRVKSLTTIATPHRGTFLAEWFQEMYRRRVPLLPAMEVFGVNMDGVRDCQRANCADFNQSTPDKSQVRYFSFGGAVTPARITPALRRGLNLLTPIEGPNDGLVSLRSAYWGEYLGTLQADHYAQTPDSVFVRPGEDFDSPGFYLRLVEDLARRGF